MGRLNERERGKGGGTTQSVRGNYKSFKGTNLAVVEGMHQFISPAAVPGIVYCSSRCDVIMLC